MVAFCVALILWYIIISLIAHCAYREWKGVAEDCAGGSVDRYDAQDGNILHYAIIAKREEDAIEDEKEREKRKKERAAKRAAANPPQNPPA